MQGIKLIFLLTWLTVVLSQSNAGLKVGVKLFDISNFITARREGFEIFFPSFRAPDYGLPNMTTAFPWFKISDAAITKYDIQKIDISSPDASTLVVSVGPINLDFRVNLTVGLYSGMYSVGTLNQTTIHTSIKMGFDQDTRKPTFTISNTNIDIEYTSLYFNQSDLQALVPSLISTIKYIPSALSAVSGPINSIISNLIEQWNFQVPIKPLLYLDVTPISAPQVVDGRLELYINGSSYANHTASTNCAVFRDVDYTMSGSVDVFVHEDMLRCLLFTTVDYLNNEKISPLAEYGMNLTLALGQDTEISLHKDNLSPKIFTQAQIDQINGRGDHVKMDLGVNMTVGVDLELLSHDLQSMRFNVTLSQEDISFIANNFEGNQEYNFEANTDFQMVSTMLNNYMHEILPINQTQSILLKNPLSIPDFLKNYVKYDLGLIERGFFAKINLF